MEHQHFGDLIMSHPLRVAASADVVLARINLLGNPYFASLGDGSMSLEHFRATQEQFFFAVRYYARPIAALVARLPDPAQRLQLVHNLAEEHGDFREEKFHPNTFRKFLASIHALDPLGGGVTMGAAVHAFNSTLMGACTSDEVEVGICCLGIIEQAFAGVSAFIGNAVARRGWVDARELVHYDLHAELDVRHAQDFFAIAEHRYGDPHGRAMIEQGLHLGAYAFDQLYRNLFLLKEIADS